MVEAAAVEAAAMEATSMEATSMEATSMETSASRCDVWRKHADRCDCEQSDKCLLEHSPILLPNAMALLLNTLALKP
jgi:hypothetical protein